MEYLIISSITLAFFSAGWYIGTFVADGIKYRKERKEK